MRIIEGNAAGLAATEAGSTPDTQKPDGGDSAHSSSGETGTDRVELSPALSGVSRALSTYSAQTSSRVQAVAAAYQNGTYQVDASAVSRAIIADASAPEQA